MKDGGKALLGTKITRIYDNASLLTLVNDTEN